MCNVYTSNAPWLGIQSILFIIYFSKNYNFIDDNNIVQIIEFSKLIIQKI